MLNAWERQEIDDQNEMLKNYMRHKKNKEVRRVRNEIIARGVKVFVGKDSHVGIKVVWTPGENE